MRNVSHILEKQLTDYLVTDQARFYRLAYSYLKNREEALDAVQTAVCRALEKQGELKEPEALRAWFYHILVHVCMDVLRSRKRVTLIPPEALDAGSYEDPLPSDGTLAQRVDALPPELRFGSDQYSVCNNFKIAAGRDLSKIDIRNYNQVCVLGARAAQNFFNYADPVGQVMQVNGIPFTVVGVYGEKDPDSAWSMDNIIVFPYTTSRILSPGMEMSQFVVKAASNKAAVEATSRISGFLTGLTSNGQSGWGYAQSNNQWQQSQNEYTTMLSMVLGGIAAISLLVGGIGIMNIMLVTVTERTREIGIRRAIGAERSSIVTQFLIEAAMICGMGGIIGIAIGTVGTRIAGKLLIRIDIWPSIGITLGAFLLSVALGILFGIYPAAKASKLQPVEALRAE